MEDKDGTFLVVDLQTSTGVGVAIVPNFWFSSNSCRYPPLSKKGNRAVISRQIPEKDWLNYPAVCRGTFGSYKEARRKLAAAEVLSDINIPSDAEGVHLGRGKRIKRPRVTYSPGDSSEDEEKPTLSLVPPIPPSLLRHQSPSFLQSNLISNGLFVLNNNTANNSSTEHGASDGYGHIDSSGSNTLTEHGSSTQYSHSRSSNSFIHIGPSGNTSTEHGSSTQYSHSRSPNSFIHIGPSGNTSTEHGSAVAFCQPVSSNSYGHFGQPRNPSTENSPSVRYCYPGSSAFNGYLGPSVNIPTDHVLPVGYELQYGNPGSSTSFSHPLLPPSIAPPQSSASIDRPGSSFVIDRPESSASIDRPESSASIDRPESSVSTNRPGSSGSIDRPGSSISQVDSGFSGEQSPEFATNGSYGHHSQPESSRHLSQFVHHVLPSPSLVRGHPLGSASRTSQRYDTSEISRSVGLTANALPAHTQSSSQGISDNGVFVGLSTRPIHKSPPADIMIRVVQSLEKIAEQQRVLEARLIAIDRRLDNMQQFQQQPQPNDPVTEIPGLPIKTLDELVAFEEHIKINEKYFEFVRFIRTIGGTSTANVVIRCWDKVLTINVKASCNWLGKKRNGNKKHALKDSLVTKAIFRGIRGTPQFRDVQESELIVETKKALRHAPERARQVAAAAAVVVAAGGGDDAAAIGSEEE